MLEIVLPNNITASHKALRATKRFPSSYYVSSVNKGSLEFDGS